MITSFHFLVLHFSATGLLTGEPMSPCAPRAGLVPIGTSTRTLVSDSSSESGISLIFKIATFRTSRPGRLPSSSLWYKKDGEMENLHYLVHIGYLLADYVKHFDRATSMDRDRCFQQTPLTNNPCLITNGIKIYPLPGYSHGSKCSEHKDKDTCSHDKCYMSTHGCEPLDSSLIKVIEGETLEEKWTQKCSFWCFEHNSCRAWVAGKSYSISSQDHRLGNKSESFRWRCWLFAAVHSKPKPLNGNIANGTMFYAGFQLCGCFDLPDKDDCNVLWTHCEYRHKISDFGKESEYGCVPVIKEPVVLSCHELPMLSMPVKESWGVVRDAQLLRKREKSWDFQAWNYTYYVEFKDLYGAEPFFLRYYFKPYKINKKCLTLSPDSSLTILVAEIYIKDDGRVKGKEKSNAYTSIQVRNLTECNNYCQPCWYSLYFGEDFSVAGDTLVVEFIYDKPARRATNPLGDGSTFWLQREGFYVDKIMIDYNLRGENLTAYANCDTNCTSLRVLKPIYTPVQIFYKKMDKELKWTINIPGLPKSNSSFIEDGTLTFRADDMIVESKVSGKLWSLDVKVGEFSLFWNTGVAGLVTKFYSNQGNTWEMNIKLSGWCVEPEIPRTGINEPPGCGIGQYSRCRCFYLLCARACGGRKNVKNLKCDSTAPWWIFDWTEVGCDCKIKIVKFWPEDLLGRWRRIFQVTTTTVLVACIGAFCLFGKSRANVWFW